jgi:hypothetical protein
MLGQLVTQIPETFPKEPDVAENLAFSGWIDTWPGFSKAVKAAFVASLLSSAENLPRT